MLGLIAKIDNMSGINELTYLLEKEEFVENITKEMLDNEFYLLSEENLIDKELIDGALSELDYRLLFDLAAKEDGSDEMFRLRVLHILQICSMLNPCSSDAVNKIFNTIELFD